MVWQYDAFEIGFITTDDFTNADILEATYPAVAKRLHGDWLADPAIAIVTGFLGKVIVLSYFPNTSFILLQHFVCNDNFLIKERVLCFFLKARKSCAVTTLGRGGSDLTATTIGKALGLPEIQVCA